MNDGPLISVIIPMYNVEKYIKRTINSLLAQTYTNFEIVIVDDGSTDKSLSLAQQLLSGSHRRYSVIQQDNQGQGFARETGLSVSEGDWIYYLDSDDTIQPFTLGGLSAIVENDTNVDLVYTLFRVVDEQNAIDNVDMSCDCTYLSHDQLIDCFLLRKSVPLVPGTLYNRSFLVRNDIKHAPIRWSEDQHYMWQVISKADYAIRWNCITYNYLIHENSIMTSTPPETIIEAYGEFRTLSCAATDPRMKEFLLPRWVLGCCRTTAPRYPYDSWRSLYEGLDGPYQLKKLHHFPAISVRAISWMAVFGPRLLYSLLRRF